MTKREASKVTMKDAAHHRLVVAAGPEFYIEFSLGGGFHPDDPIGFLSVITRIGHELSLEYDVVDTDIEDKYTFPVCGAAGGSHTVELHTTVWTGDDVRQERLWPNDIERARKNQTT